MFCSFMHPFLNKTKSHFIDIVKLSAKIMTIYYIQSIIEWQEVAARYN